MFNAHVTVERLVFVNVSDFPPHFALLFSVGDPLPKLGTLTATRPDHTE
jgi:hypothetical protein